MSCRRTGRESGRGPPGRRRGWRDCGRFRWNRAACESRSRRRASSRFCDHLFQARFQSIKCEIALVAGNHQREEKAEQIFGFQNAKEIRGELRKILEAKLI